MSHNEVRVEPVKVQLEKAMQKVPCHIITLKLPITTRSLQDNNRRAMKSADSVTFLKQLNNE